MTPSEWIAELRTIADESDWESLSTLRYRTNQSFCETLDHEGLKNFYSAVIAEGLDAEKRSEVQAANLSEFERKVAQVLATAKEKLEGSPEIEGVYFEYFYDGGDSCTGNVFLCTRYSDEEDSWGAQFGEDGFIEGPDISTYFDFDLDFEWDDLPRFIAEEYVNGMLLSGVLKEWEDCGIRGLPLGFANHDYEMVRAPAT